MSRSAWLVGRLLQIIPTFVMIGVVTFLLARALPGRTLYMPPVSLCGDNAAMIGAQAYYEWVSGASADMTLNGYASLPVGAPRLWSK